MSMWHVALLEHLERHEEMLRRVSLEHVERQEEMLRRVLTEIAAGQQELATEQRAEVRDALRPGHRAPGCSAPLGCAQVACWGRPMYPAFFGAELACLCVLHFFGFYAAGREGAEDCDYHIHVDMPWHSLCVVSGISRKARPPADGVLARRSRVGEDGNPAAAWRQQA